MNERPELLFMMGAAFTLAVLLSAMATAPVIQSTALGRKKKAVLLIVLWCIPYLGYMWAQKVLLETSLSDYPGGGSVFSGDAFEDAYSGADVFEDAGHFPHSGNCGDFGDAGDSGSCGDSGGH